jgi:hypothetical protein
MWRHLPSASAPSRLRADALLLQGIAEHAGCALACRFSSSEEYEAALVRERLKAGGYERQRRRRHALYAVAAAGLFALALWMM